eukprot:TRINITY_DN72571_c0_g1_i1.p1 TRINITY_DN72571_c0_g1~~TRINITY_DN72571_c0_g1_i1.p1  ORF type:complete len:1555 (-),score=425.51 TRINITY_DN72571_c0_g1_i1:21-4472(-)
MVATEGSGARLSIGAYAQLVRDVTLDNEYRPAVIRALLNLALSPGSQPIPLVADGEAEPEPQLAAAAKAQRGGDNEEEASEAEEPEWPEELVFRGCKAFPALNGHFRRTRDFDQLLQEKRPAYERLVDVGGGAHPMKMFCFYWRYPVKAVGSESGARPAKKKKRKVETQTLGEGGWWIGAQVGGDTRLYGSCAAADAETPPATGWSVALQPKKEASDEDPCERAEDPGGFVTREEMGAESLRRLDLSVLHGAVRGPAPEATAYFGHFCALLHLEYLADVVTVRRRLARRNAQQLQRSGWALAGLRATEVASQRKGKGKGGGKGKHGGKGKDKGNDQAAENPADVETTITFSCSKGVDMERLRFKRGDNVLVSVSDPLVDKIGEGPIQDLRAGQLTVKMQGVRMPSNWKDNTWRVDKGTNTLSYVRQLESLVALCQDGDDGDGFVACSKVDGKHAGEGYDRPAIFNMIISARVGKVDEWAVRARQTADAKEADKQLGEGSDEKAAASPLKEDAEETFPVGTLVALCGLRTEEMNGLEGEVIMEDESAQARSKGRIHIRLRKDNSVKAVRAENLIRLPQSSREPAAAAASPDAAPEPRDAAAASRQSPEPKAESAAAKASDETDRLDAKSIAASLAESALDASRERLSKCREDLAQDSSLNPSQREAIEAALEQRCSVIQGPPGTGKTTTAIQVLRHWAALGLKPLLATADGNIAVDNIAEGLAKLGVKVVRVGRPEKIRDQLEAITLDAKIRDRVATAERERAAEAVARRLRARQSKREELEQSPLTALRTRAADLDLDISSEALAARRATTQAAASGAATMQGAAEDTGADEGGCGSAGKDVRGTALDDVVEAVLDAEESKVQAAVEAAEAAKPADVLQAEKLAKKRNDRKEEQEFQREVLEGAEVICAQMISAGGGLLSRLGPFRGVLIDEAAQATELSAVVPIVQRRCERLVLSGDHCQLPPTVQSSEAERRGLTLSLYGRLVADGVKPFFLDTQFRSHPRLAEFSAQAIYDGRLRSGLSPEARLAPQGFDWPKRKAPVAFVEAGRDSREDAEGESKLNWYEAERVLGLLESVFAAGELQVSDVGVVTPYMGQVRTLRQMWRERCAARAKEEAAKQKAKAAANAPPKKKKRKKETIDASPAVEPPSAGIAWWSTPRDLEIASVDQFQGREKELIVFSAVRNNSAGRVGFLADWRRLNVMLTRARRGLIVIGNGWTLKHDPYWKRWLEWCANNNLVIDKKAWHDQVWRAIRATSTDKRLRRLLRGLLAHERAPATPKAFRAFVMGHVEGAETASDAEALWQAIASSRQEAAGSSSSGACASGGSAAASSSTAPALAPPQEEPAVEEAPPSRSWAGWLAEVQQLLEANGGELTWKELRVAAVAAHEAAHAEASLEQRRPPKELRAELRAALPADFLPEGGELTSASIVRLPPPSVEPRPKRRRVRSRINSGVAAAPEAEVVPSTPTPATTETPRKKRRRNSNG